MKRRTFIGVCSVCLMSGTATGHHKCGHSGGPPGHADPCQGNDDSGYGVSGYGVGSYGS